MCTAGHSEHTASMPDAGGVLRGVGLGGGEKGTCKSHLRADCGRETDSVYIAMISICGLRLMTKQGEQRGRLRERSREVSQ